MGLSNLANASNEKREQRIMMLRQGFNDEKYITIEDASHDTGYQYNTVKKWAIDGNIPLLDDEDKPVVPLTSENQRHTNANRRRKNIEKLWKIFDSGVARTVSACATYLRYPQSTIVSWAIEGDIPLLNGAGSVVPLTENNRPKWLDEM